MLSEISAVSKQIFELSRTHINQCDNPNCCLKLILNELDFEKKDVDIPNPQSMANQPNCKFS